MWKYVLLLVFACTTSALAHDTWVETNTNLIRTGDAVYVDLKLGNHGNNHRDFKIAGKVDPSGATLNVYSEQDESFDLMPESIDVGYAPKEGYRTAKFAPAKPGLYLVAHTLDQVVSYAPVRSIKSAKTFFVVSDSLDRVSSDQTGFDRILNHSLELVPVANPVMPMGPGQPIQVRLLFEGQPVPDATISFVPRGQTLKEGKDPDFEQTTDEQGVASFTPKTGNMYLIVAHHQLPRSGPNYESTKYSATLTVFVPEICACCAQQE